CFCFFFQAEDGIRDFHVTGVQTCALPISKNTKPYVSANGIGREREVPIQIMVPESVRREVAIMSASTGENIRTTVLRALRAIGIAVPDSELRDRRGRRPHRQKGRGGRDGSQ